MSIDQLFFLLPSKGEFLSHFAYNEHLKAQANQVWRQLDDYAVWVLVGSIAIGVMCAVSYYTWYNEMPHRHYRISHWARWLVLAFVATLIAAVGFGYLAITTNINSGLDSLYWRCALNAALYSAMAYLLLSVLWCNLWSTNAFKFLKI